MYLFRIKAYDLHLAAAHSYALLMTSTAGTWSKHSEVELICWICELIGGLEDLICLHLLALRLQEIKKNTSSQQIFDK